MSVEKIDETNDEYHADTQWFSSSQVKCFSDGPAMYHLRYVQGVRQTSSAFMLGSLVHCMFLEPDAVEERYTICPIKDRRTKAYKEWITNHDYRNTVSGPKQAVSQSDWDTALQCVNALYDHEISRSIFDEDGETESSWRYKHGGIPCKLKADKILPAANLVFDLKTISCATPDEVRRSFRKYKYGLQAAHYVVGAENVYAEQRTGRFGMVFAFVETQPPFRVLCYQVAQKTLDQFIGQWDVLLADLSQCSMLNTWIEPTQNQLLSLEF